MQIKSYDIALDIDFKNDSYTGKETIELVNDGEPVILNSNGINIQEIRVNGKKNSFGVGEAEDDIALQGVYSGDLRIDISFSNKVSESLMGFYVAKTQDGKKMLTTQFESTGARMAFPCFDHPAMKAEFRVSMTVDNNLECISNMPVESKKRSGRKITYVFMKTPKMSTYLLYFGVGEFESIEDNYKGTKIILTALKGKLNTTTFPIEVAKKSLDLFSNYFGINYALPKMHLIAVPEFAAGAMENWGAITFREIRILCPESVGEATKRSIAEVIAHEITHQWFGNLVTMKWWNDLWLNESFATFMSIKVIDHFYPSWDRFGVMLLSRTKAALKGDSLESSHPIDVDVRDPESVAQIFDEISYGKGGSVLRMIEAYVGEDNFRKGISKFLKDHSYGNAEGQELWRSLEEVSSLPVSKIMSSWIRKKGYPVVYARRSGDRIILKQEQFLLTGKTTNEIWPIPLTVLREDLQESLMMDSPEIEIDADKFIKLNYRETGFYRVFYEGDLLRNILSRSAELDSYDIFGLLDDLYAFLISGKLKLSDFLESIRNFHERREMVVILSLVAVYRSLYRLIPSRDDIITQARGYLNSVIQWIDSTNISSDHNYKVIRGEVYTLLAELDDSFAGKLSSRFPTIFEEDPNIRDAIAVAFARTGNSLDMLLSSMEKATSDEDRLAFVKAMGYLRGEKNAENVFKLIDEGRIKKQDFIFYFLSLSMNPSTRDIAVSSFPGILERINRVFAKSGRASSIIYRTAPILALTNEVRITDLLRKIKTPSNEIGVNKALETFMVYKTFVSSVNA